MRKKDSIVITPMTSPRGIRTYQVKVYYRDYEDKLCVDVSYMPDMKAALKEGNRRFWQFHPHRKHGRNRCKVSTRKGMI